MEQHFEITITACNHATWQGTLRTADGLSSFRSELELLLEMNRLLSHKSRQPE